MDISDTKRSSVRLFSIALVVLAVTTTIIPVTASEETTEYSPCEPDDDSYEECMNDEEKEDKSDFVVVAGAIGSILFWQWLASDD